jgi:hypothetical protein
MRETNTSLKGTTLQTVMVAEAMLPEVSTMRYCHLQIYASIVLSFLWKNLESAFPVL